MRRTWLRTVSMLRWSSVRDLRGGVPGGEQVQDLVLARREVRVRDFGGAASARWLTTPKTPTIRCPSWSGKS